MGQGAKWIWLSSFSVKLLLTPIPIMQHVFSPSSRPLTAKGAAALYPGGELALISQLRAINVDGIHGLRVLPSVHVLSSLHNKPTKSILLPHTTKEEREVWQNWWNQKTTFYKSQYQRPYHKWTRPEAGIARRAANVPPSGSRWWKSRHWPGPAGSTPAAASAARSSCPACWC